MLLCIALDVLCSGFDDGLEHVVCTGGRCGVEDLTDAIEHETDAVGFAECSACLGKSGAYLARGTITIVGERLYDDGGPARSIALVANFLVGVVRSAPGAAFDGAIHRVLGHIGLTSSEDRRPKPRVRGWVGETRAGRRSEFPDDFGEHLGALFVLRALPVHDVLELRMACHGSPHRSP